MTLEPLYADNHLLALAKPAGLPTVPDESGDESLLDLAKEWVRREKDKTGEVYLGVVHRLDRPVSGVVLFARTSKAASRLSEQFRERRACKLYWGVSQACPAEPRGVVEQFLVKDEARNRVRVAGEREPDAQRAITEWSVAGSEGGRVHLDLAPRTGRPHQLRVAAASLGAPLLGDLKYGAERRLPDQSIALHAVSLEIEHPTTKAKLALRCDPPAREWWAWRLR